jgi:hypothetical protein
VRPGSAAVAEDRLVVAPGVNQCVGQDREAVERPVVIDAPSQAEGVCRPLPLFESDRAKRVARYVPKDVGLVMGEFYLDPFEPRRRELTLIRG